MKKLVLVFVLGLVTAMAALVGFEGEARLGAQGFMDEESGLHQEASGGQTDSGLLLGPGTTYLGPIAPNAYGPGVNADATGRPFHWQPEGMQPTGPDPTLRVTPNAYGMGAHADQYGRKVQSVCPFGQSNC